MFDAFIVGRLLAEQHVATDALVTDVAATEVRASPLSGLSERIRPVGWSLRAALVRFAQPEPLRAAAVVELIRRAEGAMTALGPTLGPPVLSDHGLHPEAISAHADERAQAAPTGIGDDSPSLPPPTLPHLDVRIADVARLVDLDDPADGGVSAPREREELIAGYHSISPLHDADREALPAVAAVVALDRLGDELAAWGARAPGPAPVDRWDQVCRRLGRRFDDAGVARESRPPPSGRGRRR